MDRSAPLLPVEDVHLTLCMTHDCNLWCRYCYGGEKEGRHLSRETGLRALDLALSRAPARLHLIFFGGEPLLRWDLLTELTAAAREKAAAAQVELRPSVTTNGTRLTEERASWLAAEGFLVALSCDGTREAHDENRVDGRGRGSHSRTVSGLRHALEAGARVRTVVVVHPSTVRLLPESIEALADLGADDVVVNVDWSADWRDSLEEWTAAYEELGRRYVERYRRGRPFWVSVLDDKVVTHVRGGYLPSELCNFGRTDLVVAPSGRLYPCDRLVAEDREKRFVIGDVEAGLDAERQRAVTAAACALPDECRGCAVSHRCRNRCGCANLAMTGSTDRPSELLCFHEQLAIRCADAAAAALVAEENEAFLRTHYPRGVRSSASERITDDRGGHDDERE